MQGSLGKQVAKRQEVGSSCWIRQRTVSAIPRLHSRTMALAQAQVCFYSTTTSRQDLWAVFIDLSALPAAQPKVGRPCLVASPLSHNKSLEPLAAQVTMLKAWWVYTSYCGSFKKGGCSPPPSSSGSGWVTNLHWLFKCMVFTESWSGCSDSE